MGWPKADATTPTGATQEVDAVDLNDVLRGRFNALAWNIDPANSGATNATNIQAAINYIAGLSNGGTLELNEGTYVSGQLTQKTKVRIVGQGPGRTILQCANGINADFIVGENFATLTGGSSTAGIYGWAIENITIDGNKANNTSGRGVAVFGYDFRMTDVVIKNCAGMGLWSEWQSGGSDPTTNIDYVEAYLTRVKVHDCADDGIHWAGPHDSQWLDVLSFKNGKGSGTGAPTGFGDANIHVTGGGNSLLAVNCHAWGNLADYAWRLDGRALLDNCAGEGGRTAQVWVNAGQCQIGGEFFADTLWTSVKGIILGASGNTISGSLIVASIRSCESGAIDFTYSGGTDSIAAHVEASGTTYTVGTIPGTTEVDIQGQTASSSFTYRQGRMSIRNVSPTQTAALDIVDTTGTRHILTLDATTSTGGLTLADNVQLQNGRFVKGTTSGASQRRILGLNTDNNCYVGDIDNTSGLRLRSGTFEGFKADGATSAIGFYGATSVAKQTVTGSKGANAALTSLIAALVALGLITDTTT